MNLFIAFILFQSLYCTHYSDTLQSLYWIPYTAHITLHCTIWHCIQLSTCNVFYSIHCILRIEIIVLHWAFPRFSKKLGPVLHSYFTFHDSMSKEMYFYVELITLHSYRGSIGAKYLPVGHNVLYYLNAYLNSIYTI